MARTRRALKLHYDQSATEEAGTAGRKVASDEEDEGRDRRRLNCVSHNDLNDHSGRVHCCELLTRAEGAEIVSQDLRPDDRLGRKSPARMGQREGPLSTRLSRSRRAPRRAGMGAESCLSNAAVDPLCRCASTLYAAYDKDSGSCLKGSVGAFVLSDSETRRRRRTVRCGRFPRDRLP